MQCDIPHDFNLQLKASNRKIYFSERINRQIYVSISSRDKYLQHATSIMRNLLKCEKACDRACRYILCYRAAVYIAHILQRHLRQCRRTAAHRISSFDLACFRERASNRCVYGTVANLAGPRLFVDERRRFPRTLFFGNRLLAGRARDFLECFRCLVHVGF